MTSMKKPDVIFVHGFQSGRASSKWQYLSSQTKWNAHIFEVDYMKQGPGEIITDLIKFAQNFKDPILVGHSLGGFFARFAASGSSRRCILVNPSLRPTQTLFNDSERSLPKEFRKAYEQMEHGMQEIRARGTSSAEIVLFENGDEVINHESQRDLYKGSQVFEGLGGNHGFTQLNKIGQCIHALWNRPWQ